jgi:hypothetical protein
MAAALEVNERLLRVRRLLVKPSNGGVSVLHLPQICVPQPKGCPLTNRIRIRIKDDLRIGLVNGANPTRAR